MKTPPSSKPHIICYRGFPRDFPRTFLTIIMKKKQRELDISTVAIVCQ